MEQWIDNLRRQAGEYERKAPEGLLDDIKKAMGKRQHAPRARLTVAWTRRIAVAAAVIAAIFAVWNLADNGETAPAVISKNDGTTTTTTHHSTDAQPLHEPADATPTAGIGAWIRNTAANIGHDVLALVPQTAATATIVAQLTPDGAQPQQQDGGTLPPPMRRDDNATDNDRHTDNSRHDSNHAYSTDIYRPSAHRSRSGLDIAMLYSGMGGTNSNGSSQLWASDSRLFNDEGGITMAATDMTTHAHHDTPVKLGVSLRYNIDNRWSLQLGATYSRLTSDITRSNNIEAYASRQRLHYAGLSISGNYSLWRSRNVNIYLTAGAEAAKLVSGNATVSHSINGQPQPDYDERIHENRLQYSVNAAAGIEYRAGQRVSVFAEPGATHYFDNHSPVVNIYKDRPTQFNINIGLRIDLNK